MRNDMQYNYRSIPSRNMASRDTCSCDVRSYDTFTSMPIAMAYVPWQVWQDIYDAEKGLHRGTIFQELDKPFQGVGGCRS